MNLRIPVITAFRFWFQDRTCLDEIVKKRTSCAEHRIFTFLVRKVKIPKE